jgi:hypothetical protein
MREWLVFPLLVLPCSVGNAGEGVISDGGDTAAFPTAGQAICFTLKEGLGNKTEVPCDTTKGGLVAIIDNQIVGFNKSQLWSYDLAATRVHVLATSKAGEVYRNAMFNPKTREIWVSIFAADDVSDANGLSFQCKGVLSVTFGSGAVKTDRMKVRRDIVVAGGSIDDSGSMYFPVEGDVFECTYDSEGRSLEGGRILPLSTRAVFTGGASPSSRGVIDLAVSKNSLYLLVNRLGGSGPGVLLRIPKQQPLRHKLQDEEDYRRILELYAESIRKVEILKDSLPATHLCASANGKYFACWFDDQLWRSIDDGPLTRIPID